jgi:DNA-binding NarL/FixJ family response regulator
MTADMILVVDDEAVVRDFLVSVFQRAGFAVREATTGEEAIEATREEVPRLVLLDVSLPGMSGYEVCRELREQFGEQIAIVFLSGVRTDKLDTAAGLLIGADDYMTKPVEIDELLARVRRLISGRRSAEAAWRPAQGVLTQRELDILRLLAEGRRAAEIARVLVISPRTVETHIQRLLMKLGVRNRTEAVARAYKTQLLAIGVISLLAAWPFLDVAVT